MNTAQYNEKQQIELATAEGFFALYNAQFQTAYVVTHIAGDRETPDVQAKNETGKKFNLEITLTENRPGDIAALLGRSDNCSNDALKQRLEAVRRGKEPMQIMSLPDNALPVLLQRIDKKLVKRYGPNTALVVRDTFNLWDWEQVLPSVRQHLNGKTIPFDLGIWLLAGNKKSLINVYSPASYYEDKYWVPNIVEGDLVTHYLYGKGIVKNLNLNLSGCAEVRFTDSIRGTTRLVSFGDIEVDLAERKRKEDLARAEKARQDDLVREEEEREWLRKEPLRRKTDELLQEIRRRLHSDFLGTDAFFHASCTNLISQDTYEQEKITFVKSWIADNTPNSKNGDKPLAEDEQIAAIAAVHGHVQVVARAGSGKTTTLVNRTLFLLKHCGVAPSEMLLLAFNRKAVLEIRRRLLELLSVGAKAAVAADVERRIRELGKNKRIDKDKIEASAVDTVATKLNITLPHVMTFHALAYAIVHPEESILYNDSDKDSQELSRVAQQVIDDHLKIPEFKEQIRKLMLAHFREDWNLIIEGCYDQSKEEFLQFRRSLPLESLQGEYVKSFGEKVIANFLFEHDIAYKYECNFTWSGINYRPDFTIFQTPKSGIIIEYFGLKGDTDYDEMSEKKRAYWDTRNGWTLIEFSPHNIVANGVDSFLELLKKRLENQSIPCLRLSEDEIWQRIKDRAIDRFTVATVGFIGRCRKLSLNPLELRSRIDCYSPLSPVEEAFLNLAHRLYVAYLNRLSATGEEDFDGLMQRAAATISSGQTLFQKKSGSGDLVSLRYVCIDEFQDFSDLFYRLLNSIRKKNPRIELFCVGDDWQAINGFAGSDLRFFENFTDYIGESRQLYISTNYRSSNAIVAIGNALMVGLGKPAIAHKRSAGKVLVTDLNEFEPSKLEKERHPGDNITPAVLRLVGKALADGLAVVMLCRRNGLPWFVSYRDQVIDDSRGLTRYLNLIRSYFPKKLEKRITISTAHKYKGLERPMVIVLDAVARSYPLIHPDWIFSRIFGDSPEKITKEERRLLYVALTRAIETLVIITDGRNKSPFLEELERRQSLNKINWADYRSVRGATTRLLVKVGNQDRRGGTPTFAIKDLLKATGYQWQSTGSPGWAKSFPAEGFSIDTIKAEVWAEQADGIEVRIIDDTETLVAQVLIDAGIWYCVVNKLEVVNSPNEPNRPE